MIRFTTGNLLDSDAEAVVNTVNTVGVMGKGIALMFKDAFPENFKAYDIACKSGEVEVGRMFVTRRSDFYGPKWIINFPTKKHWRHPSKLEWIRDGLDDLVAVIRRENIRSIAIPPLGAGNGGLDWSEVRPLVEAAAHALPEIDVIVYEPTARYQNVAKRAGVETLTPARALIAEVVRRYWVLGIECTLLEIQKLAWFIEVISRDLELPDPLRLEFQARTYGPYADRLRHLLDNLDGSYLHCAKRIGDASPLDVIWFDEAKRDKVSAYLTSPEVKPYAPVLEAVTHLIDGFESPLGMELLATIDWLRRDGVDTTVDAMQVGVASWPGGESAARRKSAVFEPRLIGLALDRLASLPLAA